MLRSYTLKLSEDKRNLSQYVYWNYYSELLYDAIV